MLFGIVPAKEMTMGTVEDDTEIELDDDVVTLRWMRNGETISVVIFPSGKITLVSTDLSGQRAKSAAREFPTALREAGMVREWEEIETAGDETGCAEIYARKIDSGDALISISTSGSPSLRGATHRFVVPPLPEGTEK
jgi:hypothetical protein